MQAERSVESARWIHETLRLRQLQIPSGSKECPEIQEESLEVERLAAVFPRAGGISCRPHRLGDWRGRCENDRRCGVEQRIIAEGATDVFGRGILQILNHE